jgi:hypothetical protein
MLVLRPFWVLDGALLSGTFSMRHFFSKSFSRVVFVASPLLLIPVTSVLAQDGAMKDGARNDGSMKACGEKWQAAKAANATNGATWSKFLVECRAAGTTAPASTTAATLAAKPALEKPAVEKTATATKAGTPVFPAAVSAKFAELGVGRARQKTCSEQYQANKASGGNAGLRWLEKGGGYWSLCNKKLKGA